MSDPFHEGQAAAHARRMRSIMIAVALIIFVALVFVVTIVKVGASLGHGGA